MAMSMEQMQTMMARMHAQNYSNDMKLAKHFQEISNTFAAMAQGEYQMYLHHSGQTQGMIHQMPGTMTQPMVPGMPSQSTVSGM